jgi:beta-lactamase superfamily II metal-dependent hydrolase
MSSSLRIEMLPAKHGDALVVSYGPRLKYRMAIDAGPASAWDEIRPHLDRSLSRRRIVDLMVVTHVDTDHIEGVLMLLRDDALGVEFGDIWFNDHEHLTSDLPATRGGVQGAYLGALLSTKPWNEAWERKAVRLYDDGSLPAFRVDDDPASESFTLMSPTREKARRMAKVWSAECAKRNLPLNKIDEILERLEDDARYRGAEADGRRSLGHDGSAPNGSSIAFVFETDGKSVLFTGDAHASVLVDSVRRVCAERNVDRLHVDAFKLSHHGSRGNITAALLESLDCDTFLVSTNGDKFGHPDPETIDLIAANAPAGCPPTIWFNYDCPSTAMYRSRSDIDAKYGANGYLKLEL